MGRIKTMLIKRVTLNLFAHYKDKFTNDFSKNKQLVPEYADIPSKKLRNVIAGYLTRLMKKDKE